MSNPHDPNFRNARENFITSAPIKEIKANTDVSGDATIQNNHDDGSHVLINTITGGRTANNTNTDVHPHMANSSALVAIISFKRKLGMNIGSDNAAMAYDLYLMKHMTNIEISNAKSSFGKTANITAKATSVWWADAVAAGDWMFVWTHTDPLKIGEIATQLESLHGLGAWVSPEQTSVFNDEFSGLKFAGRVINTSARDSVSPNGQKNVSHTIQGQSFLELATSVYYTYAAKSVSKTFVDGTAGTGSEEQRQIPKLDSTLKNIAEKYRQIFSKVTQQSPDAMIPLIYSIIFGIEKFPVKLGADKKSDALGSPNDAIIVPLIVSLILGAPVVDKTKPKLYELYELMVGLQDFEGIQNPKEWYKHFTPANLVNPPVAAPFLKVTNQQLKGHITYKPMLWNNESIWSILNNYLNPAVNEMYTALKINSEGRIVPTITAREKPFSTGLIFQINKDGSLERGLGLKSEQRETSEKNGSHIAGGPQGGANARTLFGRLPRWLINENMIRSFSYSKSESRRVNFVQVMGISSNPKFLGLRDVKDSDFLTSQFINGNYALDDVDIQRNGLRARIIQTDFDLWATGGSRATLWSRMNADWLFNGHLKAFGSVTLSGVVEPIAEGDNCEIRGIVFHIESVTHSISVSANGIKSFTTTLQLSNGLMADGLNDFFLPPSYTGANSTGREAVRIGDKVEAGGVMSNHSTPGKTTITENLQAEGIDGVSLTVNEGVIKDYE